MVNNLQSNFLIFAVSVFVKLGMGPVIYMSRVLVGWLGLYCSEPWGSRAYLGCKGGAARFSRSIEATKCRMLAGSFKEVNFKEE